MDQKIPEPIGDLDWGNIVVDLLVRNVNLESLKKEINKAIKERLYLAYLWYLKYKGSPLDYLLDHDVDVKFYKTLFDDPTSNQPTELYLEHILQHAFIGIEIPKYDPQFSDLGIGPFEEIDGRLYIRLKVDPPFPFKSPVNDLGLPDRNLYTTGDICGLLNMHPDTFRYRLRTGKYPEPAKKAGDKRRFTLEEVREIVRITEGMGK